MSHPHLRRHVFAPALTVALLAASVAPAHAAGKIESHVEPTYLFQDWKTFDFKLVKRAPGDALADHPDGEELLRRALSAELVRTGLQNKTDGEPDFLIAFYAGIGSKFGSRDMAYGVPREWRGDFRNVATTEGTLTVDFIDAASNQLVWRGTYTDVIIEGEGKAKIPEAVTALVRRFLADRDARAKKSGR